MILALAAVVPLVAYGVWSLVTLQRGTKRSTIYFPTLVNHPEENIFVAPGDTIYVFREQQKFLAIGLN